MASIRSLQHRRTSSKPLSRPHFTSTSTADVEVSLSSEFGDVGLKLKRIVFTDGSKLWVEGEHDHPYVTDGTEPILPSEEILSALSDEENN